MSTVGEHGRPGGTRDCRENATAEQQEECRPAGGGGTAGREAGPPAWCGESGASWLSLLPLEGSGCEKGVVVIAVCTQQASRATAASYNWCLSGFTRYFF